MKSPGRLAPALVVWFIGCSDVNGRAVDSTDSAVTPDLTDVADVADASDVARTIDAPDATPSPDVPDAPDVTDVPDVTDAGLDGGDVADASGADASDAFVVRVPDGATIDGAVVCHAIINDAPEVVVTAGVGAPPAPRGGVIVSGHYHLRGFEVFGDTGLAGTRSFQTADIGDGVLLLAARTTAGDTRWASTYTLAASTMFIGRVCPMGMTPTPIGYTATPSTVTFVTAMTGQTIVTRYERQ
jgi:hypothetical protein